MYAQGFVLAILKPVRVGGRADAGEHTASSTGRDAGEEGAEEPGRSRSIYDRTWRRQYVYVAATLPAEGGRSVATDLKRLQPDAVRSNNHISLQAQAFVLDSD